MKKTGYVLASLIHALKGTKRPRTAALILAGGSGTRLGADKTKQQIEICGKSVVAHTLLAFEECLYIDEIVVAAKKDEIPMYRDIAKKYGIKKLKCVTAGGEDRGESALCAFEKISDKIDYVAIHDAARCLITAEQIRDVAVTAFEVGAAVAASHSKDTVKIVKADRVKETPDRDSVWLASTPQIIRADIYRACAYMAKKDSFKATDDASLVERLGFEVAVVNVGDENIKITTKTDLLLAEALLKRRQKEKAKQIYKKESKKAGKQK